MILWYFISFALLILDSSSIALPSLRILMPRRVSLDNSSQLACSQLVPHLPFPFSTFVRGLTASTSRTELWTRRSQSRTEAIPFYMSSGDVFPPVPFPRSPPHILSNPSIDSDREFSSFPSSCSSSRGSPLQITTWHIDSPLFPASSPHHILFTSFIVSFGVGRQGVFLADDFRFRRYYLAILSSIHYLFDLLSDLPL